MILWLRWERINHVHPLMIFFCSSNDYWRRVEKRVRPIWLDIQISLVWVANWEKCSSDSTELTLSVSLEHYKIICFSNSAILASAAIFEINVHWIECSGDNLIIWEWTMKQENNCRDFYAMEYFIWTHSNVRKPQKKTAHAHKTHTVERTIPCEWNNFLRRSLSKMKEKKRKEDKPISSKTNHMQCDVEHNQAYGFEFLLSP